MIPTLKIAALFHNLDSKGKSAPISKLELFLTEWNRSYIVLALPCEQFLQAFEIYRALLRAKEVGEKRAKIQKPEKIAHKEVVLILLSL